jgi:hypothetical protein
LTLRSFYYAVTRRNNNDHKSNEILTNRSPLRRSDRLRSKKQLKTKNSSLNRHDPTVHPENEISNEKEKKQNTRVNKEGNEEFKSNSSTGDNSGPNDQSWAKYSKYSYSYSRNCVLDQLCKRLNQQFVTVKKNSDIRRLYSMEFYLIIKTISFILEFF